MYFIAAGELLTATIIISWIISLIAQPISPVDPTGNTTVFEDNALKRRIGYNNLCVGFDTAPAKYVASVCWVFIAYCGFRYGWLDLQRTELVKARLSSCKYW